MPTPAEERAGPLGRVVVPGPLAVPRECGGARGPLTSPVLHSRPMSIAGSPGPGAAAACVRHDRVAQEAWMRVLAVGARPDDTELGRGGARPPAPTPARPSHLPRPRVAAPTAATRGLR